MTLNHGYVKVEHIRQMKRWDFTTSVGNHVISLYELQESNVRTDSMADENENQEIEVVYKISE